jgi:hypothetical protein
MNEQQQQPTVEQKLQQAEHANLVLKGRILDTTDQANELNKRLNDWGNIFTQFAEKLNVKPDENGQLSFEALTKALDKITAKPKPKATKAKATK